MLFAYGSSVCTWATWFLYLQLIVYNRNTQFHSTVAFTDSLTGSNKSYTDLEKYKTEAQNLGTMVSI